MSEGLKIIGTDWVNPTTLVVHLSDETHCVITLAQLLKIASRQKISEA